MREKYLFLPIIRISEPLETLGECVLFFSDISERKIREITWKRL